MKDFVFKYYIQSLPYLMSKYALLRCLVVISLPIYASTLTGDCSSTILPFSLSAKSLLEFVDLRVSCGSQIVTARLKDCSLQALGHNATAALAVMDAKIPKITPSMVSSKCKPHLKSRTDGRGYDAVFRINISDCSPITTTNTTHLTFNYTIRRYLTATTAKNVDRGFNVVYSFACVYLRSSDISIPVNFVFTNTTTLSIAKLFTSDLEIAMAIYEDSSYATLVSRNLAVDVTSSIYTGLSFAGGNTDYLILQATLCWATPTSNRKDANNVLLLNNGCPNLDTVILYENYYSTQARFSFTAFTWGGLSRSSQLIYLHCKVSICDTVLDDTCTYKNCNGTSEVINSSQRKRLLQINKSQLISIGPIKVYSRKTGCSRSNGGCQQLCTVDLLGRTRCACMMGYHLKQDWKSCSSTQHKRALKTEYSKEPDLPILEMTIAIISFLLLIGCVVLVIRRSKHFQMFLSRRAYRQHLRNVSRD